MSKESVRIFNVVANNAPSQGDLWEVWKQLSNQVARIKEETLEAEKSCQEENMAGLIDDMADIWYTYTYLEQLLEAFGVDVKAVKAEVCRNNSQKYTKSYTYAAESKEVLEESGVECYVDETVFQGETYYTVRRNGDLKILKLRHHEAPDLAKYTPKEFL